MQINITGSGANQLTRAPYPNPLTEESKSYPVNIPAKGLSDKLSRIWADPVKLVQSKLFTIYLYAIELLYIFYK